MREDIEKTRQRIRSLEFDISQLEERKQDCLLRLKLRDLECYQSCKKTNTKKSHN